MYASLTSESVAPASIADMSFIKMWLLSDIDILLLRIVFYLTRQATCRQTLRPPCLAGDGCSVNHPFAKYKTEVIQHKRDFLS